MVSSLFHIYFDDELSHWPVFQDWCKENPVHRNRVMFPVVSFTPSHPANHVHVFFAKVIAFLLWCEFAVTVYLEKPEKETDESFREAFGINEQFYRKIARAELDRLNAAVLGTRKDPEILVKRLDITDESRCMALLDLPTYVLLERQLFSELDFNRLVKATTDSNQPRIDGGRLPADHEPVLADASPAFHEAIIASHEGRLEDTVAILCGRHRMDLVNLVGEALAKAYRAIGRTDIQGPGPLVLRTITTFPTPQPDGQTVENLILLWPHLDGIDLARSLRRAVFQRPSQEITDQTLVFTKLLLAPDLTALAEIDENQRRLRNHELTAGEFGEWIIDRLRQQFEQYANVLERMDERFSASPTTLRDIDRILPILNVLGGAEKTNLRRIFAAIIKLDGTRIDGANHRDLAYAKRFSEYHLVDVGPTAVWADLQELENVGLIWSTKTRRASGSPLCYFPASHDYVMMRLDLEAFADRYVTDGEMKQYLSECLLCETRHETRTERDFCAQKYWAKRQLAEKSKIMSVKGLPTDKLEPVLSELEKMMNYRPSEGSVAKFLELHMLFSELISEAEEDINVLRAKLALYKPKSAPGQSDLD